MLLDDGGDQAGDVAFEPIGDGGVEWDGALAGMPTIVPNRALAGSAPAAAP